MSLIFTAPLPCKPPTPNSRLHHMARYRLAKQLRDVVALVGRSERNREGIGQAFTHRFVHLTLITGKGSQMLDADNLAGACKPMLDGCRDAGLILDDRAKFATVTYAQERGPFLAVRVEVSADALRTIPVRREVGV